MAKAWKILPQKSTDLVTQLLINRGIKTEEEKERFFNPKIEYFEKEFKIPGIPQALKRIKSAIEKEELICVYGDYDVDGVCASAVLYKGLVSLGAKVLPYIPHREKEGYGLSKEGLDSVRDSGASLVITVDQGIVALEQAKYAKELGLDLIITDHHLPKEEKPQALVIVHSTAICGAGVAWCLIKDVISKNLADELLEFVGLATVCDLMPLLGVNRGLVYEGLKQLNKTDNVGLQALFREAGVEKGGIISYTIGHVLGPRLNAIGRLEHAIDALRLLCTKDPLKARKLASLLTSANLKRQELTTLAVEEAKLKIDTKDKVHVLHSKDWIPGIVGLIAGRISDETGRPALAISVGESVSKGSARSVDGINIVETIRGCSELLIDVGGHKGAAGFTIETNRIEDFKKRLLEVFEQLEINEEKVLEIEAEVPVKNLTKELAYSLEKFEPIGFGNSAPLLVSRAVRVSDIRTVGEGKHLKFKGEGIDAIAFGKGELSSVLKEGSLVALAFYLEINRFNGSEILQLKVRDINLT